MSSGYGEWENSYKKRNEVWWRAKDRAALAAAQGKGKKKHSAKDIYDRDMKSLFSTWCYQNFGGQLWYNCLVWTGMVPPAFVDCVNDVITQKILEQAGREAESNSTSHIPIGPRLSVWQQASSRGEAVPEWSDASRGVQHKVPEAKEWRDFGRQLDKIVERLGEQCTDLQRRGRSAWNIRVQCNEKKEQADRTWDTAMVLSVEAGVEFTDHGRPCFYCGLVALAAPQSSVNSA